MKKYSFMLVAILLLISCKKEVKTVTSDNFVSFGDSITLDNAISKEDLFSKYKNMKTGDTLEVKFSSKINDVCQKKGCWMNLELPENKEVFVKFKDYGFFMPLNSKNSEVTLNGKAFVSEESVDELRHYAKDAGKSQAAIDSIVAPERSYSFLADGVLLKK
jgi:hypothetical protein